MIPQARRYVRMPSYVTAIQYDGSVESAIACQLKENPITCRRYIDTKLGRQWVSARDWVVTDQAGGREVLNSDTFALLYEEVE